MSHPVKQREITFNWLRSIVISLYEAGVSLKSPGLTSSHESVGNEYIKYSQYLDDLMIDLEHDDVLVLQSSKTIEAQSSRLVNSCVLNTEEIINLRAELRAIRSAVATEDSPLEAVLLAIQELKDNYESKRKRK